MPCSPKGAIGVPSALALVFSFIIVIFGIVIMTSTIPESKCGTNNRIGVNASDKDGVDSALMLITWPLLLGGLLGLAGSGLGIFGGFTANKCGVCSAAVLLAVASIFVIIGALAAGFFAAVFSNMCDNYTCGSAGTCSQGTFGNSGGAMDATCSQAGVCCKQDGIFCFYQCKETNDWACDIVGKKTGGTIVGWIGFIMIMIATCINCAGSCCCPAKFDGLDDKSPGGQAGGAVPQAQVVGQVVGAPVGDDNKA